MKVGYNAQSRGCAQRSPCRACTRGSLACLLGLALLVARASSSRSGMGRATCLTCTRPESVCVCAALPQNGKIGLRTKVMVVQHPCECKKKMIGTVPLMELVLSNFELVVARGDGPVAPAETRPSRRTRRLSHDEEASRCARSLRLCAACPLACFHVTPHGVVQCLSISTADADADCDDSASGKFITIQSKERNDYLTGTLDNNDSLMTALEDPSTLILYPGPGAVDIEGLQLDGGKARTLIVVDGTWRQAGRVMREECITKAVEAGKIKRVQFANAGRSDYKFRKEPKKYCISSLESVAYCLRFLGKLVNWRRMSS